MIIKKLFCALIFLFVFVLMFWQKFFPILKIKNIITNSVSTSSKTAFNKENEILSTSNTNSLTNSRSGTILLLHESKTSKRCQEFCKSLRHCNSNNVGIQETSSILVSTSCYAIEHGRTHPLILHDKSNVLLHCRTPGRSH